MIKPKGNKWMINMNKNKKGDLSGDKENIKYIGGGFPLLLRWQHKEYYRCISQQNRQSWWKLLKNVCINNPTAM